MPKKKTNINKEQGIRLSSVRKKRNVTQERLAELTSYSVQTISGIENGTRRMTLESATAFSQELLTRVEYLMCDDDFESYSDLHINIQQKSWDEFNALEILMKSLGYSYEWIELNEHSNYYTEEMRNKGEYPVMIKLTSINMEKIIKLKELESAKKEMLEFIEFKLQKLLKEGETHETS